MEETGIGQSSKIEEEVDPQFFIYTSETKDDDIPKETLTHLRVDSSVAEIPTRAFRLCKALVHVQLPATLTSIGEFAFASCFSLKFVQFVSSGSLEPLNNPDLEEGLVEFPASSTSMQIGNCAFGWCHSLRKVIVCSSSTKLGEGAFKCCSRLLSVELPEGLEVIPEFAFDDCQALVQVQLPETLKRIGYCAFSNCKGLKRLKFVPEGSPDTSSSNPNLEEGTIVFPETANLQIDYGAFMGCLGFRKVIICSASTKLGGGVFSNCRSLLSVELPDGLQVIEQELFGCCVSLEAVKIPSSVIKIGETAFSHCSSLTSLDFPHGLLEIGQQAFFWCRSIETLHVPSTVSSIGSGAFEFCKILTHITLPLTLKRIEERMFKGCCQLEFIDIPSAVTFIGKRAFLYCNSLSHIRIPPSVESIVHNAFIGCSSLISIEVPEGILIGNAGDYPTREERFQVLVNLAIPTLPEDDEIESGLLFNNSKLASVVDNEASLNHKLKHRFDHSPLNKLCYYQSYHAAEDAMMQLRTLMEDGPLAATNQTDEFGMTPLHVLSLSQVPNLDMLLSVLNEGNVDHMVHSRDSFGSTPMDYLCLNRMPNSTEVIRRVLYTRFDYLFRRSWKSDMVVQAIDKALAVDFSSRRREIVATYLKLAKYERKVIFSLVELRLWKNSGGASVVISNVLLFLESLDVEDYFSHSP
eukprot:scaffold6966_cov112-Cylindrotheca_fusiformis.AAC.5